MLPVFFENSKVPKVLSKVAPIEINAITLGPLVFSRGELSDRVKRHETIHWMQYKELFIIGFLLVYLYDYLFAAVLKKKGFNRQSYMSIRFEQEAYDNDVNENYLKERKPYKWLDYPLGGNNE